MSVPSSDQSPTARRGRRNHSAFGSQRERAVKQRLEDEGAVVLDLRGARVRANVTRGTNPCDFAALRGEPLGPLLFGHMARNVWLVEVKATERSPWVAWGPAARKRLSDAAKQAGAGAVLAWWPPHGELQWIGEAEWPSA